MEERFPTLTIKEESDGKSLLETLDSFQPDMVLMAIRLPRENGLSLSKKIKETDTKVLKFSGWFLSRRKYAKLSLIGGAVF